MDATVQNLAASGATYGMLWIDVEGGSTFWSTNTTSNVDFISRMISRGQAHGVNIGMYTSASQWGPIGGTYSGFGNLPLWYAHYDGSPSFSDFSPFGGWYKPAIKQYRGDASVCGAGIDENFY